MITLKKLVQKSIRSLPSPPKKTHLFPIFPIPLIFEGIK